jgi:hypothetical protein
MNQSQNKDGIYFLIAVFIIFLIGLFAFSSQNPGLVNWKQVLNVKEYPKEPKSP